MKKFMVLLTVLAAVGVARAWNITVPETNATVTTLMVVPPVLSGGDEWRQVPERSTGVVVNAGAVYRIGRQLIVAAHAGTMTNSVVSTTTYVTNGTVIATNVVSVVAPITVPTYGLSGYDGSVRWFRARSARDNDVRIQLAVGGGAVALTSGGGNTLTYTASGTIDFPDYEGSLYVSKNGTEACSAAIFVW